MFRIVTHKGIAQSGSIAIRNHILSVLFAFCASTAFAEDAIPPTHVGTWKRTEVINKTTGQGERAGRRYFMIMKPDGEVIWTGTQGAPNHPPMKIIIRNGSEMFQKTAGGEKSIGKAIATGDTLKLLFRPVSAQPDSGYVRVSKSVDPKDVAGLKP